MCDELGTALSEDELDVGRGRAPNSVQKSLSKIRSARLRLKQPPADHSTPAALMSQIELYDVLLDEIRSITSSLDKRVEHSGAPSRRPMANRRHRGTAHLIVPHRTAPGRTKQQR
ncbi:hypothetical protein SSBR45G_48460 [Bradyrhizobium sp. SSBR45G]|uniref:hypothetical protein n=1 Tax=unclassified Bradyrhizobium TaxID=2631580 RepID=UPI002342B561|nr:MULTISPECIES: hypothetical protein [unclassified Bradyrhizobium]GLH79937.1 hypothetical protein SSBR45G_48460 [Bradyrhizobium sp. SSBR45G]GLH87313.1 hypothetical protein SSBR45R_47730 [Bradyrhizobium sp. SSBR45R]